MNNLLRSPRGALVLAKIYRRVNTCKACAENRLQLAKGLVTAKDTQDQKKMQDFGSLMLQNSCEECQAYVEQQINRLAGGRQK